MDLSTLDNFTKGYIDAALFTDTDGQGNPLDDNFSREDIHEDDLNKIIEDCKKFQEENKDDLEIAYSLYVRADDSPIEAYAGHDFWLTRNGHGAGFWDRGLQEVGERLTDAANKYGQVTLYVGDDGKLYIA